MTACPKWKDELLDLALGLPPSRELEEHLKECLACSEALAEFRRGRERMDEAVLKLVPRAEPSAAFRAQLMARLEEAPARQPAWSGWAWVLTAAAWFAVISAWLVFSNRSRRTPKERERILVSSEALVAWQSPTGSLLRSSADKLLGSVPRLGDSYFHLQGTVSGTSHGKKRKG
jgi:anti-sigma factor RsiW